MLVTWQYFKMPQLLIWLCVIVTMNAIRYFLSVKYSRLDQQRNNQNWEYLYYLGVIVSGSVWGSIIWLKPDHSTHEMHYFILLVLTGMAGGALATNAASSRAYTLFVIPLLGPLAIQELSDSRQLSNSIGLLIIVFIVLTHLISRNNQKTVEKFIRLSQSNSEMCEQIQIANNIMEDIFCSTHVLFATLDIDYNYLRVNKAFAEADNRGLGIEDFVGKNHFDFYPDAETEKIFNQVRSSGEGFYAEAKPFPLSANNGNVYYWDWNLKPVNNIQGQVDGFLLTLVDVSAHKRSELAIQEKEIFINSIMETALDCIVTTDSRGKILLVNSRVTQEFGYQRDELIGQPVECLMPNAFRDQHKLMLKDHAHETNVMLSGRRLVSTAQRKNGESFPIEVAVSDTEIEGVRYFVAVLRDVSETQSLLRAIESSHQEIIKTNKKLEERNAILKELSSKDALTSLYNRRYFNEHLISEWNRAIREDQPLSIMMFDIDYFKQYNDEYGHQQGDDCLKQVASCLTEVLHRPADLIARYGGEEFVALLPATDTKGACVIAENMRSQLEQIKIEHKASKVSAYVTVSIGVASTVPEKPDQHETLVRVADKALYNAKAAGRNRVVCDLELSKQG